MRRPFDSLDDFTGKIGQRKQPDPPATRYVEPLGTRQEIEPLAVWDGPVKNKGRLAFSWPQLNAASFDRSFALAGLVIIALVIGSSIYFRVSDVAVELSDNTSNVADEQQPDSSMAASEEPVISDLLSSNNSVFKFDGDQPAKRPSRSRSNRPRVSFAAFQLRHQLPRPQFIVSDFIPTTLVIYVENGVVKTRIEPQTTAAYFRQRPTSN